MKMPKKHHIGTAIGLLIVLLALCSCASLKKEKAADYDTALFDQSYVHQIDVRISEADWEDLKANPLEKTKYTVDVVIDGEEYREVHDMLLPYVQKDPTAFYSVEEFEEGFELLMDFCRRRAQSIRLQLEGSLHTDSAEQQLQSRVDASDLDVFRLGGPDWVYCSKN